MCMRCSVEAGVHPHRLHQSAPAAIPPPGRFFFVGEYYLEDASAPSPLAVALHRFKYGRDRQAGHALQQMLATRVRWTWDARTYDAVIPVPLHSARLGQRGFNQAAWLARAAALATATPLASELLVRIRTAPPHASVDRASRQRTIIGAFQCRSRSLFGTRFLLVDDVYTTGATMADCMRALEGAGTVRVDCLTLLRTKRI
jgi:ComF family protein